MDKRQMKKVRYDISDVYKLVFTNVLINVFTFIVLVGYVVSHG